MNKLAEIKGTLSSKIDILIENQNQLDLRVESMNERIEVLEVPAHETSESDDETMRPRHRMSPSDGDNSPAYFDQDDSNEPKMEDLLDQLHKKYTCEEILGDPVDNRIAEIVNKCYTKKSDKQILKSLIDDNENPRPSNRDGLRSVTTNRTVWDLLSDKAKTYDKKLQTCQKAIIKAGSLLSTSLDKILKDEADKDFMITNMKSVVQLLGDCNYNLNMTRRCLIRPELRNEYKKLCLETVPFSSELFGDEVEKTAKDVSEMAKIGNKMHYSSLNEKMTYNTRGSSRFSLYPQPKFGNNFQRPKSYYYDKNNNQGNRYNTRSDNNLKTTTYRMY